MVAKNSQGLAAFSLFIAKRLARSTLYCTPEWFVPMTLKEPSVNASRIVKRTKPFPRL